MSQQLINLNTDLKHLQDDGYTIRIEENLLVTSSIPYVNNNKEIKHGVLVCKLDMSGDKTIAPSDHVIYFAGDHPCNKDGIEIPQIKHQSTNQALATGVDVNHSFSAKPSGGYKDFYEKVKIYADIISGPAEAIDPTVSAKVFRAIPNLENDYVFNYIDTASSRAGINLVTDKLKINNVAIVGLGGTGSYVLDLIAKTPIRAIHLFDADKFSSHNAFRSPGAPSIDELNENPKKVAYFRDRYSKMHKNIIGNDCYIDESNTDLLSGMDFVFVCIDSSSAKKVIIEKLQNLNTPFVDVGMGIYLTDTSLGGTLRVTASTDKKNDHIKGRIPLSDVDGNDEYTQNIQIADLNALNATLAVIKWKKIFGFYNDFDNEHHSTYTIDGNTIHNVDLI